MTKQQPALAEVTFKLRPEDTRSLTATQLGDVAQSRITLGSAPGKLKKRDRKKDDGSNIEAATVAAEFTSFGGPVDAGISRNGKQPFGTFEIGVPTSVSVWCSHGDKKKDKVAPRDVAPRDAFCFAGISVTPPAYERGTPSPGTRFVWTGTVNVGTGDCSFLFNKQGHLEYDSATGKAILSIYGRW
jgi:hypothetical protein